jgi:hypothetical protein
MSPVAVENSLLKLAQLAGSFDTPRFVSSNQEPQQQQLQTDPTAANDMRDFAEDEDDVLRQKMKASWRESLNETQWLRGVQQLLETTLDIVNLITNGEPVRK